jgi:DNA-binding XRE family transcriptional regulator
MNFSDRIKQLREAHNLTQTDFGKRINISRQCVYTWEKTSIMPSVEVIIKIAKTYSVSADWLLGLSDKKTIDVTSLDDRDVAIIQELADRLKTSKK